MIRRVLVACSTVISTLALLAPAAVAAVQTPPGQSEFVPAKDLPPTETIPAAPLLVAAYAIIWLAVMVYVWALWRRLNRVETEMRALTHKSDRR
jgi:CcmD family protein